MSRSAYRQLVDVIVSAVLMIILVIGAAVFCNAGNGLPVCRSVEEAGTELRTAMKERAETFDLCLVTDTPASDSGKLISEIFEEALKHTGDPCEGDYLKFQYESCNASAKPDNAGSEDAIRITYSLSYYDTAEQELETGKKSSEILESLDLEDKTDPEKIRAIYDYICENVEYDYDNLEDEDYSLKRTAYAALVDGKAVCQGYSAAVYRLLLEAGIDNRIIYGTCVTASGGNEEHTWNIVKLGDDYFNLDVTRDDELGNDDCFLKGGDVFNEDHFRSEEYNSEEFTSAYSISDSGYGEKGQGLFEHVSAFSVSIRTLFRRLLRSV